VNAKPASQLGKRLFAFQSFQRNPRLEIGLVLLPFRHR